MNEPILQPKDDEEHIRSQLKDIVTETQAEANRLITEKYNTLKSLWNQMTDMRRKFNGKILTLQSNKRESCSLLSKKIEMFCEKYKKLYPNMEQSIQIESRTEKIVNFDGNAFQVQLKYEYLNVLLYHFYSQECYLHVQLFNPNDYMCNATYMPMDMHSAKLHIDLGLLTHEIETIYQSFDTEFKLAANEYYEIALSIKFMELHYLTVYQELMLYSQFDEPQKLLLETIADLTIQGKRIEKEIEIFKIPFKRIFESDDSLLAAIDINTFMNGL